MFGAVLFACICFFFVYVLLAGSPVERLNRSCLPMNWVGKTLETIGSIGAGAQGEEKMGEAKATMFNTCRFALYRQFYSEEHKRLREQVDMNRGSSQ